MNEGFDMALMLLAVGMITVFTILALIVFFGNVLITLVNTYIPETKISRSVQSVVSGSIDPKKMAAIISAVDIVTQGNAKVTSITKSE
ncbi:MAG: OadG family protein [Cytophagales bacterium]|nr:OadG family protein [Cytophagales bacterium]